MFKDNLERHERWVLTMEHQIDQPKDCGFYLEGKRQRDRRDQCCQKSTLGFEGLFEAGDRLLQSSR